LLDEGRRERRETRDREGESKKKKAQIDVGLRGELSSMKLILKSTISVEAADAQYHPSN
jgi:hypothetical protein